MKLAGAKMLAVAASVLVHGALATTLLDAAQPVETAGGGSTSEASLGSSFADMTVGTMSAETATEAAEPTRPTATPADPPDTRPAEAQPVEPAQAAAPSPSDVAPSSTENATPATTPEMAANVPSDAPTAERVEATGAGPAPVASDASEATSPDVTAPATTADTSRAPAPSDTETLTSEEVEPGRVLTSPRPAARTDEFEERHRRTEPPRQTRRADRTDATPERPNRGNNESIVARAGSTTGRENAASAQANRGSGAGSGAGDAAASNYDGQVMGQLSRVPPPRVGSRGTARVAFSIAGSGALASLSLVQSSGSPALDNAALQIVRRAAPFPQPPRGARTSFQIGIEGR